MQELIDQAVLLIQEHQAWAGLLIFLFTFGESLFIVGLFLPATVMLFATGTLIGSGTISASPILLWGFAGAVVGDAVSFWLGRWLGPKMLRHKYLNSHRRHVARARLFFYRFGFLAVLLGRFLGPLRSLVPTVAGGMGMPELRFQLANIISAALWMPALLAPGYLAAISVDAVKDTEHLLTFIAIGLAGGVVIIWLIINKRKASKNKLAKSPRQHRRNVRVSKNDK
jgi:membrane protein DedA with SNARE-associated domain